MVFLFMTRSFILLATIFLLSVLPYVISDTTEISFDWNAVGAEVCSCDWRKNSDAECKCSLAEASGMATNTIKSTCKSQEGVSYCLNTLKSAYKACTKTKYPNNKSRCIRLCQELLDNIVSEPTEELNKTVRSIGEDCLEASGKDLSEMLEELQYHKGTRYTSCCDEIASRNYQSWTCSQAKCKEHLQTLDVRISYANLEANCVDTQTTATSFSVSDASEAILHLKSCLKVAELNKFPRGSKVPTDPSLSLSFQLPAMNGLGLYCCNLLPKEDQSCNDKCRVIFSKDSSRGAQNLAEDFDLQCGRKESVRPAISCVQNIVAGQCRPGCSRMNFCSSFNNQPDFTFRRCTDEADQAASSLFAKWVRENAISFEHLEEGADDDATTSSKKATTEQNDMLKIPLNDISNCDPQVFRAIACALTIKPCSRVQTSKICWDDCYRLLSKCANASDQNDYAEKKCTMILGEKKVNEDTFNNEQAAAQQECVSIYALSEIRGQKSSNGDYPLTLYPQSQVTYPCSSSNMCRESDREVCEVSRPPLQTSFNRYSSSTVPNKCNRGCSVQAWTTIHMMFLPGDLVITNNDLDGIKQCVVCRCVEHINPEQTSFYCDMDPKHLIEAKCELGLRKTCPIPSKDSSDKIIAVNGATDKSMVTVSATERSKRSSLAATDYMFECNFCSCLDSVSYCTKRLCHTDYKLDNLNKYGFEFTGMPSNADDEYLASCASNGRTYPNDQVTEALGIRQYQLGPCEARKRCWRSMCPVGFKCVTNREVCLTKNYECIQHRCVREDDCRQHVCDEQGNTHASRCDVDLPHSSSGRAVEISYPGRCDQMCELRQVCGTNGHSYSSPCAAYYDRVLVDYPGRCRDFATQITDKEPRQCYKIGDSCAPLPAFCQGVHAFGVCCPICGSVARLILVPDLVDMVHLTLRGNYSDNPADQYTVRDVVLAVRQQITLPQCDVFGHLSLDDSVTLLFTVPFSDPSSSQVQACNDEAQRLISMFAKRDVSIISNIHLFPVAGADLEQSFVKMTDSTWSTIHTNPISTKLFVTLMFMQMMNKLLVTNSAELFS
ncbi:reversion-inducing cysteine-rich protein with Kazal motifs-like isoform X2 [Symsagittifera roscoffensis]|uniref:reversion-inducing cysteine-rich protein with Kazal motifs-like isoform X2 n=1 Tax=Symsagittifera roscoffensis TaxID=84072 RepID=UPI00307CA617